MHYDSERRWDIFKGICKHCVAYQMFYVRKKGSQVATLLPSDAFSKSKQMAKASTLAQIFATTTG